VTESLCSVRYSTYMWVIWSQWGSSGGLHRMDPNLNMMSHGPMLYFYILYFIKTNKDIMGTKLRGGGIQSCIIFIFLFCYKYMEYTFSFNLVSDRWLIFIRKHIEYVIRFIFQTIFSHWVVQDWKYFDYLFKKLGSFNN
jgi:hypothetical protein